MDATSAKLLISLAIFLISFFSSAAPLKVINVDDNFFSIGNLLASGVLLAGGLVHQLPDSMANLEGVTQFPLAAFLSGFTFCMFLILEEYLHAQFETPFGEGHHECFAKHDKDVDGYPESEEAEEEGISKLAHAKCQASSAGHSCGKSPTGHNSEPPNYKRSSITFVEASYGADCAGRLQSTGETSANCNEMSSLIRNNRVSSTASGIVSIRKSTRQSVLESFRDDAFEVDHPIHHHDDHLAEHMHGSLLAAIILLLALSVHSIFEGLAIGVAADMSQVLSTTAAVLAHKAFAGYALGSSMVASQMKEGHFLVLCLVFACCSVVGVFMGMLFEQFSGAEDSTSTGIIQAMVSGTFLYVSIVEIGMKEIMMHREASHQSAAGRNISAKTVQFVKLGAFLVGYCLMSGLAIWV